MATAAYTITPARYSKGNFIVQTHNEGPWKGRAERLIVDGLKCRYTGRERGFVASAAKVRKFEAAFAAGWDFDFMTRANAPVVA